MSKREMDRTWIKQGAESRIHQNAPGEDITREAAVPWLNDINGLILDLSAGEGQLESLLKPGVVVGLDENIKLLEHARMALPLRLYFISVVGSFFSIPQQYAPASFKSAKIVKKAGQRFQSQDNPFAQSAQRLAPLVGHTCRRPGAFDGG